MEKLRTGILGKTWRKLSFFKFHCKLMHWIFLICCMKLEQHKNWKLCKIILAIFLFWEVWGKSSWNGLGVYSIKYAWNCFNPLSANFTKWSNTLKQFVGNLPTNCLSVFHHFVGLALKGLSNFLLLGIMLFCIFWAGTILISGKLKLRFSCFTCIELFIKITHPTFVLHSICSVKVISVFNGWLE